MKTAVSLPDPLFQQAERYARKNKQSRSALYAVALADYLARHDDDAVTAGLNSALEGLPPHEAEQEMAPVTATHLKTMRRHNPW